MESNSEKIKSDDGFRPLTKEKLAALPKEELDQYLERYKEHSRQSLIELEESAKKTDEMYNKAIKESKLLYPEIYADVEYIDTDTRPRGPLTQEQIDAILGPASEPPEKETE